MKGVIMFNTTKLAGGHVLVKGTDTTGATGTVILDGSEWTEIKRHQAQHEAVDKFDDAVSAFLAPLNAALDQLNQANKPIETDPLFYIQVNEGTEAVEGEAAEIIHLSQDSAVLRLIEQDPNTDRLLWVNDTLVITEAPAAPAVVVEAVAD